MEEEYSDVWQQTLAALKNQMAPATFNAHLATCEVVHVAGGTWTVSCAENSLDWLQHRLDDVVLRELRSITEEPVVIEWAVEKQPVFFAAEEAEEEEESEGKADVHFDGVYHDRRNAIIMPLKIEVHTQYFRRKWRPKLGPTVSELIRELRQRCYHSKDNPAERRNSFKTTNKSLGKALNVSESTILRILKRDDAGNFENEYLGRFIKSVETITYRKADGKIRNEGTRFTIYLDEPLIPDDEEKLKKDAK